METIIIDEKTVSVNGVEYLRKEEPKPVFKVGDWAAWMSGVWKCSPFRIVRINEESVVYSYNELTQEEESECDTNELVSVTPKEIEAQLIKIAKEKGFKEGITVKCLVCGTYKLGSAAEYRMYDDRLFFYQQGLEYKKESQITLYYQGKWAEIIPDKKKLPDNKVDLGRLINLYHNQNDGLPFKEDVMEFLRDYKDYED